MRGYNKQPLGSVLRRAQESVVIDPQKTYKQVTVRLFHKGLKLRGEKVGSAIRTTKQCVVHKGQVLLSRIDARNGAIGIVPPELDGAIVTNDFWAFEVNRDLADPAFLDAYFGTSEFVDACNASSEGTTNRVRLQPSRFLRIDVPLPPRDVQRRIVSRIEDIAGKIEKARTLRKEIVSKQRNLLLSVYTKLIEGAKWRQMKEIAPLVRRPITIDPLQEYNELGIRSFGKGTFHKAAVSGASLGSKRVFQIEPGDLLFNIVFAWEGAVAVARPEDKGRVGSHRFLSCVPKNGSAVPSFLRFHFLTERGLEYLGIASPGGAGRNRTLGLEALARMEVPVPPIEKQLQFASLMSRTDELDRVRTEAGKEIDSLMPSILSKAFSGEP